MAAPGSKDESGLASRAEDGSSKMDMSRFVGSGSTGGVNVDRVIETVSSSEVSATGSSAKGSIIMRSGVGVKDDPSEVSAGKSLGVASPGCVSVGIEIKIASFSGISISGSSVEATMVTESGSRIKDDPSELSAMGTVGVISIDSVSNCGIFKVPVSDEVVMISGISRELAVTGTAVIADTPRLDDLGNLNIVEMLVLQLVAVSIWKSLMWICGTRSVYDGVLNTGMAHHDAVLKLIDL